MTHNTPYGELKLALTTAPSLKVAEEIASTLVAAGLVACVNIIPGVTSVYRWQGAVHADPEVMMIMKFDGTKLEHFQRKLLELHPYEVPEFVVLPSTHVSDGYLAWALSPVK